MIAVVLHLDDSRPSRVYGIVLVKDRVEQSQLADAVRAYHCAYVAEETDQDVAPWLLLRGFQVTEEYDEEFIYPAEETDQEEAQTGKETA